VLELEVVTLSGDIVRCSADRQRDYFDAVRCGLGQFGVITKARLRLTGAPQRVHYHRALYGDFETFFSTLNALLDEPDETDYEGIQGFALANNPQALVAHIGPAAVEFSTPPNTGPWVYCIEAVKFLDKAAELSTTAPRLQNWLPGGNFAFDLPYLAYIDRLGSTQEKLTQLGLWQLPHPILDLLLPGSQAQQFIGNVLESLDPAEVAGPVLVYPYQRNALRTPLFRAPAEARVVLFGLMRTSIPPLPAHVQAQITSNRHMYEQAAALGGYRYPIDSVPMTAADWRQHFGEQWQSFLDMPSRAQARSGGGGGAAAALAQERPAIGER
jgi:hypothetical protein